MVLLPWAGISSPPVFPHTDGGSPFPELPSSQPHDPATYREAESPWHGALEVTPGGAWRRAPASSALCLAGGSLWKKSQKTRTSVRPGSTGSTRRRSAPRGGSAGSTHPFQGAEWVRGGASGNWWPRPFPTKGRSHTPVSNNPGADPLFSNREENKVRFKGASTESTQAFSGFSGQKRAQWPQRPSSVFLPLS